MLVVALDAGEAYASQFHGFGQKQPFSSVFFTLARHRRRAFGSADVLALGGGQLLACLGLFQDALAVVLGQRGEDGEPELVRRRSRVDAQVQVFEVSAALVNRSEIQVLNDKLLFYSWPDFLTPGFRVAHGPVGRLRTRFRKL